MNLPIDRAESCEEEFELANDSWGPVFDELAVDDGGDSLTYAGGANDTLLAQVTGNAVADLNTLIQLPHPIEVRIKSCGEANAFYDPDAHTITMCSEFEDHLRDLAELDA